MAPGLHGYVLLWETVLHIARYDTSAKYFSQLTFVGPFNELELV